MIEALPQIISDRCVHSLIANASCRICVDTCPTQAWVLDDDLLGIDATACDGCGLCAADCPQSAISFDYEISIKTEHAGNIALVACERSGIEEGKGLLPCIHMIGLTDILHLYNKGVRQISVATGACAECPRGKGQSLTSRLTVTNVALRKSGLPGIELKQIAIKEWVQQDEQMREVAAGPWVNRRGFLRAFIPAEEQHENSLVEFISGKKSTFIPPGQLLPEHRADPNWPFLPSIDPVRCAGCDACVKTCPQKAIVYDDEEVNACYRLEPALCSGCGLCMDICDQDAVVVNQWEVQTQHQVLLESCHCAACGSPYHRPAEKKRKSRLCQVCSRHNHYQNLFQVIG